jgi:hypothetical protein
MTGDRAFKMAKLFAWLGLISLFIVVLMVISLIYRQSPPIPGTAGGSGPDAIENAQIITFLLSSLSTFVATIGTASAVLLAWRTDRRQAEELKLKIAQLELQLAEANTKSDTN